MITIKKGGIVHQMMHPFGIFSELPEPKTICGVFWGATLIPLITLLIGFMLAFGLGHVLAGLASFIVTGMLNPPTAVTIVSVVAIAAIVLFIYCTENIDKVGTKLSKTEVVKVAKEAYKNHKEKHCTLVQYEE